MRSALWSALVLAALVAAAAAAESSTTSTSEEREGEQEDESDSAPFMIVVEHGNGRRCGGSLVSLRTALTSAGCVRGAHGGVPRELWARAVGAAAVRRVARVALAEPARPDAADLAVLELEAPFGGGARARPILMATQPAECAPRATCHVVRALGRSPRLRIVDAALEPPDVCGRRARDWPDAALCLVGPTLCGADWGAGVVCEGKLCGVLSRSARALHAPPDADALDDTCGDTHAAQSVARWRRFLHCAHTLRACGRGGDCAQLCSERRLLTTEEEESRRGGDAGGVGGGGGVGGTGGSGGVADTGGGGGVGGTGVGGGGGDTAAPERGADTTDSVTDTVPDTEPPALPATTTTAHIELSVARPRAGAGGGDSRGAPTRSSTAAVSSSVAPAASVRPSFEFEPNRPDFKGGPARTSRVYLKAGEYGDNGAEYGGEEAPPPTPTTPTRPSTTPAAPRRAGADLQAQVSLATTPPRTARSAAPYSANALSLLILIPITINIAI